MRNGLQVIIIFFLLTCFGCNAYPTQEIKHVSSTPQSLTEVLVTPALEAKASPTPTVSITAAPTPTHTPTPTPTPFASGPTDFPSGVNPLTGLFVTDASRLTLAPGLVSISNAPVTTRPQSGLSYASQVYEFYLGEGDTRFLSVFYGNLPPQNNQEGSPVEVGPLRSGRLPYETLRDFYRGFLVFASASDVVLSHLNNYQIIQNANVKDINGAAISVNDLLDLGKDTINRLGPPNLTGLRFDPAPPDGGKNASQVCLVFHTHSQVYWKYDPQISGYTRWQNDGEGTDLRQFTDRLNNQPLTISNLIVLFTNYVRYTDTFFNIDFQFITRYPALLFRDGRMYEIYWTTRNETYEKTTGKLRPPRFIDYDGNPFPLKPGQTWIEIVQLHNPYFETDLSYPINPLRQLPKSGTGQWEVEFVPPDYSPLPTP